MTLPEQAKTLRTWLTSLGGHTLNMPTSPTMAPGHSSHVIAVASGKGGVGKTTLVANLAIALSQHGSRVMAIDADLGLANLDLMFGVTPRYTILDLLEQRAHLEDVLIQTAGGVHLLPASSGRFDMANLSDLHCQSLLDMWQDVSQRFDFSLVDTGAGIAANTIAFAGSASEVVIVVTPEPASFNDAYALIKVLSRHYGRQRFHLIGNRVSSSQEGESIYIRLAHLVDKFLDVSIEYMGAIHSDTGMMQANRCRIPILLQDPHAPASRCIQAIAYKLQQNIPPVQTAAKSAEYPRNLKTEGLQPIGLHRLQLSAKAAL